MYKIDMLRSYKIFEQLLQPVCLATGVAIATIDDFMPSKKYLTCNITPNTKYIFLGTQQDLYLQNISKSYQSIFHLRGVVRKVYSAFFFSTAPVALSIYNACYNNNF